MYKNIKKCVGVLAFSLLCLSPVGCGPSIGVEGYYPLYYGGYGPYYYRGNSGYYWGTSEHFSYNNNYNGGYGDGYFFGTPERYYHNEDYSRAYYGGVHEKR